MQKHKTKYYILFVISAAMIFSLVPMDLNFSNNPSFGVVIIDKPITSSREIVSQLNNFNNDDDIDAIIVRLNTPGGVVAPSQEIYEKVKSISESNSKPIIASMGSIATSGGYYIAMGADTIVANKGTLTGSIGVIMNYPILSDLLDDYGVDYKTIKSGLYKDSGSAFRHSTISDSLYFQEVVDNMYEQFTSALKYERGLSDATIQSAANGKVYTGLQAKQINLIDVLGTFEDSINLLLSTTGNIGKTARIVEDNEEPFSLFNEFFNKTNQAISFNKMLLFPLPEFKLYY
jgi:protease-4